MRYVNNNMSSLLRDITHVEISCSERLLCLDETESQLQQLLQEIDSLKNSQRPVPVTVSKWLSLCPHTSPSDTVTRWLDMAFFLQLFRHIFFIFFHFFCQANQIW